MQHLNHSLLAGSILVMTFSLDARAAERSAEINISQQMAGDPPPAQSISPSASHVPRYHLRDEQLSAAPGDAHLNYIRRHHLSRLSLLLR
jgi:hypothetical protein